MVHALAAVDTLGQLLFLLRNCPAGVVAIADRSGPRCGRVRGDLGHCTGSGAADPAVTASLDRILLDEQNSERIGASGNTVT